MCPDRSQLTQQMRARPLTTAPHAEDRIETYDENRGNHLEDKPENHVEDVKSGIPPATVIGYQKMAAGAICF